jgi:hypothetical protein
MSSFTFLSLAPTTSASYPSSPLIKSPVQTTLKAPTAEEINIELLKSRRSSSLDSESSGKLRFLKLGPVHYGKGDGLGDWSEAIIAE